MGAFRALLAAILVPNGLFITFRVSPFLPGGSGRGFLSANVRTALRDAELIDRRGTPELHGRWRLRRDGCEQREE